MLECLTDGFTQILDLLSQHHAAGRADPTVELVVLRAEVLAWIEDVVGKFEAEVEHWDTQVSPSLIQQILDSLRAHEFKVIIHSLLQELPMSEIDWARFHANELRIEHHVEVVWQRVDQKSHTFLGLIE